MKQKLKIICASLLSLAVANCATYRMSEEKQKAIMAEPHGMLEIVVPNGKQIDGYEEKWNINITQDGETLVQDKFSDDEIYRIPMKAGKRAIFFQLQREVSRPFRVGYSYSYVNHKYEIDIEANKTARISFEVPEKSLSVGYLVFGMVFWALPIFAWPAGDWPTKDATMKPTVVTEAANAKAPKAGSKPKGR